MILRNSGCICVNLREAPEAISWSSWQQTIDLNLSVPFFLAQSLVPGMRERGGGNIIKLASSAAMRWDSGNYGVYAAEKEAIRALTRAAANEWGALGIRSNSVLPLAKSPALEAWATYRPEEAEAFMKTVPMQPSTQLRKRQLE